MRRKKVSSGTEWEDSVGYSRAVRVGPRIYVSGTTATDDSGKLVGAGDAYAQAIKALENIEASLEDLDASLEDVVRTRMYVTDISYWEEIGQAHAEFLEDVRPATSMVQVDRLIDSEMIVEIEAEAIVSADRI